MRFASLLLVFLLAHATDAASHNNPAITIQAPIKDIGTQYNLVNHNYSAAYHLRPNGLENNYGSPVRQDGSGFKHFAKRNPGLFVAGGLATVGIFAHSNTYMRQVDRNVHDMVVESGFRRTYIDDYMQYVPAAAVFILDPLGAKAEHNFGGRLFGLASAYIITLAIVQPLKHTVKQMRPDTEARTSFPSGHTATAFTGAHFLFLEYRHTSPWIGVAGYALATTTGVFRVLNQRHWMSDVVMGAAIGILGAQVGYMLIPVLCNALGFDPSLRRVSITAAGGSNWTGAAISYSF